MRSSLPGILLSPSFLFVSSVDTGRSPFVKAMLTPVLPPARLETGAIVLGELGALSAPIPRTHDHGVAVDLRFRPMRLLVLAGARPASQFRVRVLNGHEALLLADHQSATHMVKLNSDRIADDL